MLDKEIFEKINEGFEKLMNQDVEIDHYRFFAPKASYYAMKENNYFVIGTRLIVNPLYIGRKKNRKLFEAYWDEFIDLNVDYAEAYKTRNEALRAVARNRKGLGEEPKFNEHSFMKWGVEIILTPPMAFNEEIFLGLDEEEEDL